MRFDKARSYQKSLKKQLFTKLPYKNRLLMTISYTLYKQHFKQNECMYFQPDAALIKLVHIIIEAQCLHFQFETPPTPFLFCLRDRATQQQSGNTLGNRVKIKQSPGSNPVCLSGAAAYIVFGTMYKYKKSTDIFHGFFPYYFLHSISAL